MILTDYLLSTPDIQWETARQLGVSHATLHDLAPRYGKNLLAIGAVLEHSPSPLARR